MQRAGDRMLWTAPFESLPTGTVVVPKGGHGARLVTERGAHRFAFGGWGPPDGRFGGVVDVLTPPTSVSALAHGFAPVLHHSATEA